MTDRDEEFYIGYEGPPPAGMAARVRGFVILAALSAVVVAALVLTAQRPFAASLFEYGQPRERAGRLVRDPYPALIDLRARTRTLVVAPGKFGADALVRHFEGRDVRLQGEGIARGATGMVQLWPSTIVAVADEGPGPPGSVPPAVPLGRVTLRGEIVDSKCFLGVMNPGARAVHRDCAVRCLSGGIPPMLWVRHRGGDAQVILVSADGQAIGRLLLDLAGRVVEVTGDLERRDDLLYLRADRGAYDLAPRR